MGDSTVSDKEKADAQKKRQAMRIRIALVVALIVAAVLSGVLVRRSWREFGTFLALVIAGCATGALVGFLVGSPGLAKGDDAADKANELGWSSRLGVFGNWITGAAFVLVSANAGKIVKWFASVTRTVASNKNDQSDVLFQYTVSAWVLAATGLGFILGYMQMVTSGRRLIEAVEKAEQAAETATAAAIETKEAATEFMLLRPDLPNIQV